MAQGQTDGEACRQISVSEQTNYRWRREYGDDPVYASIYNRFNKDRDLNSREAFKQNRSIALAEWRQLAA